MHTEVILKLLGVLIRLLPNFMLLCEYLTERTARPTDYYAIRRHVKLTLLLQLPETSRCLGPRTHFRYGNVL